MQTLVFKLFPTILFISVIQISIINHVFGKNVETDFAPEAVFTELNRLIAPDGMGSNGGDQIGKNVAISGNTVIVGSSAHNNRQGAAYVFVRSGDNWTFQQKLVSADEAFDFGKSVAISGDTILVGAPSAIAPVSASGAVYVFTRNGTTWTQQQKIFSGVMEINQNFGASVAMTDNTAIIGSPGDRIGENGQQGSAYIYTKSGAAWGFQARLTAADGTAGDNFGGDPVTGGDVGARRVAVNGDTVVVGAAGGIFGIRTGSAYVFNRNGASWSLQQKLTAFDAAAQDAFGFSVDVSGNSIIVGAAYDDIGTRTDAGSAYVFTRNGSVWTLQQKLIGEDDNPSGEDNFGTGVAISGDTALVGAPGEDIIPIVSGNGAAFLFKRTGTTWTNRAKFTTNLQTTPSPSGYRLGTSVALGGNTAIAGVPLFTTANGFVGAAYVFNAAASNTPFDFDGDAKADISVFRQSDRVWYLLNSTTGFQGFQFGLANDKIVPADYDGDGKTDIAVFRDGTWYLLRSQLGFTATQWGSAGDIPLPYDFDGDGKADLGVFRNGVWFVLKSSGGVQSVQWGIAGDVPTVGDYDGDGKADYGVFRNGFWYLLNSTTSFQGFQWGTTGDKPVQADYDGDGKTDIGVFRNGTWFILRSQLGTQTFGWGSAGDIATPADYDGDGKADFGVFRNGVWYLSRSTSGVQITNFGLANDKPLPASYIQ